MCEMIVWWVAHVMITVNIETDLQKRYFLFAIILILIQYLQTTTIQKSQYVSEQLYISFIILFYSFIII